MKRSRPKQIRPGWASKSVKIIRMMKLAAFFLFISCLHVSATAYSQKKPINLSLQGVSLEKAFNAIGAQSGYLFLYNDEKLSDTKEKITLYLKDATIAQAMDACLKGLPLSYQIIDNTVLITPKAANDQPSSRQRIPRPLMIRGRVFDQKNPPDPLAGVTVLIKGTTKGTVTDSSGFFEIAANTGDVLVFSYLGYITTEYTVGGKQSDINISLQQNLNVLDQAVVTGYSEQKVKNLASSISVIPSSNIENKPITQLSQALQGGVTGLTVQQGSGLPGGDAANIKIRGINTLGNTDPLVLVDGVPFDLNNIDPTTVQSVTILKDAAAASIYGARAANGVILVTTKRGVAGQVHVTYDAYAGFQKPTYIPKFVDAARYMEIVNEADANVGEDPEYPDSAISITRSGSDPLHYPNTDWVKEVLHPSAFIMNHTVGVTGGNSVARFAVNASYLSQGGIMKSVNYDKFMLRANTSLTLRKNLSMYLDLNVIRGNQEQPYVDGRGGAGWVLYMTYGIPPNIVAKYPTRADGLVTYGQFGAEMFQPVAQLDVGGTQNIVNDNVMVNFQPSWEIVPGLNLKVQYNFQINASTTTTHRDAFNFIDYFTNNLIYSFDTRTGSSFDRNTYNYLSGTLDYTKNIGKHRIFILGGASQEYNSPDAINISTLRSVFGKLYYSYDERFLLEAALRGDGSSRFGPGRRWGSFPSIALGWNVSNEAFMQDLKKISNWKLRASYGLLGNNQNVGNYAYQTTISPDNGVENSFGNPDITWEKDKMLDIGTDLALFNADVTLTIDWYNKITDDILLTPPLPEASGLSSYGVSSIAINAGKVRNRGWEFALNLNKDITPSLNLFAKLGLSSYKNTILSLPGGPYFPGNTIDQVGEPIGVYYGYKTSGLIQESDVGKIPIFSGEEPGDIKYTDLTGDGILDDSDRAIIGNPNPEVNYFIDLGGKFKGFDFEVLLNGYGKSTFVYTNRIAAPLNISDPGAKPMVWQTDYWTPDNPDARFPRIVPNGLTSSNVTRFSDFWFENDAYAKIRYIQLGYTFNKELVQRYKIGNLRIYLNAENPFTFTRLSFLDPESEGDETTYPLMRIFTFGLNVTF